MKTALTLFSIIIFLGSTSCKKTEQPTPQPQGNTNYQPGDISIRKYFSGAGVQGPAVDKDGIVWARANGLGRVNKNGSTHVYKPEDGLGSPCVYEVAVDSHNNKWVGTYGGGLYKFDGTSFTRIENLLDQFVHSVAVDANDNVWVGSEMGLCKYENGNVTKWQWTANEDYGTVQCLAFDTQGRLWMGCYKALLMFDGNTFTPYLYDANAPFPFMNGVQSLAFDAQGKLWVGNGSNLATLEGNTLVRHHSFVKNNMGYLIYSINHDSNGEVWMGTQAGVYKYDGGNYSEVTAMKGISTRGCAMDTQGNFWYGTINGLIKMTVH